MAGILTGIEIASRALQTSQGLLNVVGQNVANANTPGYSRQVANVQATDPDTQPGLGTTMPAQWGTGVEITSITRAHDELLDQRINVNSAQQNMYSTMSSSLSTVQALYSEPGSGGISGLMTAFFNSFSDLANNPESTSLRTTVIQAGTQLAQKLNSVSLGLSSVKADNATQVAGLVDQVNQDASQIAALNKQIRVAVAAGEQPNDLMDRRDALAKDLAGLVGSTSSPELTADGKDTGSVTVTVNGFTLVQGATANTMPSDFTESGGAGTFGTGLNAVTITSGTIGGLMAADGRIDAYATDLNTVASTLITQVNDLHRGGNGLDGVNNRDFFSGADASDIAVSPFVAYNPSAVAAASAPQAGQTAAAGNGDNAQAIADLANKALFGTDTLSVRYNAGVAQIGADIQSAASSTTDCSTLASQLTTMQSSTEGVSLDEEMTKMLVYQQSYQAAAKLLASMDSLLTALLNAVSA